MLLIKKVYTITNTDIETYYGGQEGLTILLQMYPNYANITLLDKISSLHTACSVAGQRELYTVLQNEAACEGFFFAVYLVGNFASSILIKFQLNVVGARM